MWFTRPLVTGARTSHTHNSFCQSWLTQNLWVYGNNVDCVRVCLHREPLSLRWAASSVTKPFTLMLPQKLEWAATIMTKPHSIRITFRSRSVQIKSVKATNTRVAVASTSLFVVIIPVTHNPVQSGLFKPTQLCQAGGHRSSHWGCKCGQNTCWQIRPNNTIG